MRVSAFALLAGAALYGPSAVFAQDGAQGFSLEEIVVTARKREEGLQSTPIAITAVTAKALEERGIVQLEDVATIAPNVSFSGIAPISGNPSAAVVYIRGVGQNDFTPVTDPGVGIYVDGVYIARSVGAALDLIDIERIEVLRGPQGTLFGRNTIGGAISLFTQDPGDDPRLTIAGTTGADNRAEVNVAASGKVTDEIGVGFSGLYKQRDGYVLRLQDGLELGNDDVIAGRVKFSYEPTSNFRALLAADYTREDEETAPTVPLAISGTTFPFNTLYNLNNFPGVCITDFMGPGTGTIPASALTNPNCQNEQWVTGDPFTTNETGPSASEVETWGVSLTLDWDLGPAQVKSITAFRALDAFFTRNADGSPFTIFETTDDFNQDQFSQELQVTGAAFDDIFEYVVGAYYFREDGFNTNLVNTSIFNLVSGGGFENTNFAFYGEGTVDLLERVHLTAGIRYTDETKGFTPNQIFVGAPEPLFPAVESEVSFSEWTPRATIGFDVTPDILSYFTYSRGFKSGGFTQRYTGPTATGGPIEFDPEFVDLFEVGLKSEFPDYNLRVNIAGFYSLYEDIQVSFNQPGEANTITGNAAEGEIRGFEVEMAWIPIPALSITGTVGFTDAEYTDVGDGVAGLTTDDEFIRTPKWNSSLGVSYLVSLGQLGSLTPRVDWLYVGDQEFEPVNVDFVAQDAYNVVNTNIRYDAAAVEGVSLTFGVTNVTNEEYFLSADSNPTIQLGEAAFARPRQWFLTLRYDY
ncbi:MAG: TonB-dependent receptor [Pseudomonadota bacterium]